MNNIPKEGEIWTYGDREKENNNKLKEFPSEGCCESYEIGDIKCKGIINIRKYKEKHITWIPYEIKHFSSALWKKISDAPNNIIPEKWVIKWENNAQASIINNYLDKNVKLQGWRYTKEDIHSHCHVDYKNNYYGKEEKFPSNLTLITFNQFKEQILKENNNKLKEFPSEGCCESIDIDFEKYLRNIHGSSRYSNSGIRKGISWGPGGWGFVSNINSCTRKQYKIEELEHFFKKENKKESITINKKENYEHTKTNNKSIKICRPNIQISQGLRKRGFGIKSTGIKISIGNRHCNN